MDQTKHYGEYLEELQRAIASVDSAEVFKAGNILKEAYGNGGTVYSCGNGGSAATASHLANELGKCCATLPRKGFRVLCLSDNVPQLTAYANDEGYERAFAGQLEPVIGKNDALVCISGSGNSPNVLKAAELARERGAKVITMTGFDGGKLKGLGDARIHVAHEHWGRLEDAHMIFVHYLGNYLRRVVFSKQ